MMQETSVKKTFVIEVGEDEHGLYYAIVKSVAEEKGRAVRAPNMRLLMTEVSKVVRKRSAHLHQFPLPDPSPIITLEQDRTYNPRIITPPNGSHGRS